MNTDKTAALSRTRWAQVCGIASGAAIALALLAIAFVWPAAEAELNGFTIAITGEPEAVAAFTQSTAESLGEVVNFAEVPERSDAISGLQNRTFIGALVLGEEPEVLFASASGPVPASFMSEVAGAAQTRLDREIYEGVTRGLAAQMSQLAPLLAQASPPTESGPPDAATHQRAPSAEAMLSKIPHSLPTMKLSDIAPYSEGDSSGSGITAAGIPLTVGSLLASILIAFTIRGRWQRMSAVLIFGVVAGLILNLSLGSWLEVLPGNFGHVWLALSLSVAATSALFVGLHSLLGRLGLGFAAALTLFAAMPWAAFAVPFQFLPAGLGNAGQLLIPGATTTLLRTITYFPDADAGTAWWTLATWALAGSVCLLAARAKSSPSPTVQHPEQPAHPRARATREDAITL